MIAKMHLPLALKKPLFQMCQKKKKMNQYISNPQASSFKNCSEAYIPLKIPFGVNKMPSNKAAHKKDGL